ncbi:MFS transporter [Tenggerimyces flavus]|uniref:MFS transporter n=1 Tax=Tenggerimyces flavus TaxID=1708749 RepID=A0ABV7Y817_9ACTN|nr:MFS transporter [Tenggerimyces flavus]MBM7785395.1 DHA2 family multidrug resistance protein-like MFS transporter [Tenggerimyces flavus]
MTDTATTAGRREWLGLVVLSLPAMLITLDFSVLNLAVPALSAALEPSSTQLLWIVDSYGFMLAGFLITMGTLGDRIGRRKLLLFGAGAFGIASIVAAYAPTAELLIVARVLLGVAGATLAPSTLSLIRTMFADARQRTVAISAWAVSLSVGGALGPVVGGVLLEHFWWGSVFLVAVPVMVLLLVVGPVLLPEYRSPSAGRIDLVSVGLSLATILPVIYGLKELAKDGFGVVSVLAIVLGLALGYAFVRRQGRLADPLIDLRLFRSRVFSAALVTNTFGYFAILGAFFLYAQYLQLVVGLSPLQAGIWSVPAMVGLTATSVVAPVLLRKLPVVAVLVGGLLVASVGFWLFTLSSGALAVVVAASVVYSAGLAPVFIAVTDLMVTAAPESKAGAVASISETSNEFGGALGIAVLGSLTTLVYRQQGGSGDALGGEAFSAGMHVVGWVAAGITVALAVLALVVFRKES